MPASHHDDRPPITRVLRHYFPDLDEISSFRGEVKTLCPWHDDTTPSASVNTKHQVFYCHACGKACDSWQIIMEMEGVKFGEAVRLAESLFNHQGGSVHGTASKRRKPYSPSWAEVA